jgi:hypothetical protein
VREAQDKAAKASWAHVAAATLSQPIDSREDKMEAAYSAQREGFEQLGTAASVGLILVPMALWAVVVLTLGRAGTVSQSLRRLLIVLGLLLMLALVATVLLSQVRHGFDVEELIVPLAAAFGLALLVFVGFSWVKGDAAAKSLVLLLVAWGGIVFLLTRAADRGGEPREGLLLAAVLGALSIPGAFLLFGQGRWADEKRMIGALATGLGFLSALPALLVLPAVLSYGMAAGPLGGAMVPRQQFGAFGNEGMGWNADGVVMVEEAAMMPEAESKEAPAADERPTAGEAPRLRQWFPETLYWAPDVQTDDEGHAGLEIPMADSITTWRLTALASSQDGRLGFVTHGLRVFQDFFVDVDLPVSLTEGDEISIPVGVFNYLPEAQEVRLVVEQEGWFELLGEGEQTLIIASNDIEVVYFPIRVVRFGRQGFQVTAWGEMMSDAVRREVDVVPDGKEIRLTESDWLRGSCEVVLDIPAEAVPGTSHVEVKVYPGVLAQVVEGLEKILRLPHG